MPENSLKASYVFLKSRQYVYLSYVFSSITASYNWIHQWLSSKMDSFYPSCQACFSDTSELNMFVLLNLHFSYNHVLGTILKLFQLILLVFIQCQVSDIVPLSELLWSQIGYPLPFCSDVDSLLKKGWVKTPFFQN